MTVSPTPPVAQRVTGEGHVFTGSGDVYHISRQVLAQDAPDRDVLEALRRKVVAFWVDGVLANSIHHAGLLALEKTTEPAAVEQPWARVLDVRGAAPEPIPAGKPIGEVFEEAHRMLIILGEPGAGKTTTLLQLARGCAEAAAGDVVRHPVPVVLNLSTWPPQPRSFAEWVVAELSVRYRVGRRTGRKLLKGKRLLLLLDGLDEMREALRPGFVGALHRFIDSDSCPGIALTCRSHEYASLNIPLRFGAAVRIEPLDDEQVSAYVDAAGGRLDLLGQLLRGDPELREMARSPLMLSILTVTYLDAVPGPAGEPVITDHGHLRDQVFSRYVSRVVAQRPGDYAEHEIRASLHALAAKMSESGQTVFAMRDLQPSWLRARELVMYTVATRALAGAGVAVCIIIMTIVAGSRRSLTANFDAYQRLFPALLLSGLITGILAGLGDALRFGRRRSSTRGKPAILGYLLRGCFYFGCASIVAAALIPGALPVTMLLPVGALTVTLLKAGGPTAASDINLREPWTWSWKAAVLRGGGFALAMFVLTWTLIEFGVGVERLLLVFFLGSKGLVFGLPVGGYAGPRSRSSATKELSTACSSAMWRLRAECSGLAVCS